MAAPSVVNQQKGLTALKDGMDRYKVTVKDSKFAPLRKKCEKCLSGFGRGSVDDCIALACESIAATSTDAIVRACLDILEVVLSYELTKDSKTTGNILRAICKTPWRGRPDDLTHKLLRNLSRCEVHHFVEITVFEQITSTIFELMNLSNASSAIDASCKAGLAHLLSNRLLRYEQPREESETDGVVGTPDYVAAVILMKATEIEANRADTFFEIVLNLFRECPQVIVQPKSADLVMRHVLPRCLQRPRHPSALTILGGIVAVFAEQAYPYAEVIFRTALLPALKERQTATDAMTVFLDIARKPAVVSGLLAYYDCSESGARPSLVQQWVAAVCGACASTELRPLRTSLALLLRLFVDFFAALPDQDALKLQLEKGEKKEDVDALLSRTSQLIRNCEVTGSVLAIAKIFNSGDFKAFVREGIKSGHVASDSPADQATFIYSNRHLLDKLKIGEYLAKRERKEILHGYVHLFDFRGLHIDQGLRRLMGTYKIVGEADIVDRTTDYFAARFCDNNPDVFSCVDTAGILAFSTMMLNTDQHSPNVKTKMEMHEFVRNNRGIDNGKDLDKGLLEGVYSRIKAEEIVLEPSMEQMTPQQAAAKARQLYGEFARNKVASAAAAASSAGALPSVGTGGWSGASFASPSAAAAQAEAAAAAAAADTAAVLAPPQDDSAATTTTTNDKENSAPTEPIAASAAAASRQQQHEQQQQQQQKSSVETMPPLDARISHIIIGGTIESFVTAVANLVVTDSSREAAVATADRLIKLACVLGLDDALKAVVGQLCAVCKETKYTAALRLSALSLLVESVLERSSRFQGCWAEVAEAMAACGMQFAVEAAVVCEKLSSHMVGSGGSSSSSGETKPPAVKSSGENLAAYVLGLLKVLTSSDVAGEWYLTADSFLTKAVLRAVGFVCGPDPEVKSLWREKIFPRALPLMKKAIFRFPTNQCADALDRICTASLTASAQCTALVLFVCREFAIKNPAICMTFLTTTSLIELGRCDDDDFERLVATYQALSRTVDTELRFKAFDAFRSLMLTRSAFSEMVAASSSSSSSSSTSNKNKGGGQRRANMVLRVAATLAAAIPSGGADEALYECSSLLVQSDRTSLQNCLMAASGIASLVSAGGMALERRQAALGRLLEEHYSAADEESGVKSAVVVNVLVPLFETLVDQVAVAEALFVQKQHPRTAASSSPSSSAAHADPNSSENAAGGDKHVAVPPPPVLHGGRGAAVRGRAGSNAGRAGGAPSAAGSPSPNRPRGDSGTTAAPAAPSPPPSSAQAAQDRAAADRAKSAHVELATKLFHFCAPIAASTGRLFRPYETAFLLCAAKHSLRSVFPETQAIAMGAVQQLSKGEKGSTALDADGWEKVTALVVEVLANNSSVFTHGEVMTEHHVRYWTPLLMSVAMHAANPSAPSPLVGPRLSGAFADLLSVCSRAPARNGYLLEFERNVLRIGSQVAAAAKDFGRVGAMAETVAANLLEQQEKQDKQLDEEKPQPAAANSKAAAIQQQQYAHAIKSATQFVEWVAHLDGSDIFVAAVRAAYPSLCDMIKCGNALVGAALSMVFHRLAPVVHRKD